MSIMYRLEQIQFAYRSEKILDMSDFSIEQGSIVAIVGANGSGKTTLLNLLALVALPDSGSVIYKGEKVTENRLSTFRKSLGYVQQKPYLLNMSVRDNIELGLRFGKMAAHQRHLLSEKMMHEIGIGDLADRFPTELSGGEVQKVAIARALVMEPDVLILDEPFTHLDRQATQFFEKLITTLQTEQNKTILFTSHDHVAAQLLSDTIYSMVRGQLVSSSLTNLYYGQLTQDGHCFETEHLQIQIPKTSCPRSHLTIDPEQLVLSREKLQSSMRNQFQGQIVAMRESQDQIEMSVDAGEIFKVIITQEALQDLNMGLGDRLWVSFKSSAVHLF